MPGTRNATLVSDCAEPLLCNSPWRSLNVRHLESLSNPPHGIRRVLNRSQKHLLLPLSSASRVSLQNCLLRVSFVPTPATRCLSSEVTCHDGIAQHVSTCSPPAPGNPACCCRWSSDLSGSNFFLTGSYFLSAGMSCGVAACSKSVWMRSECKVVWKLSFPLFSNGMELMW